MKFKSLYLGLLSLGLVYTSTSQADNSDLKDFTPICTLDESCAVEGTALVAFGSKGHYTYRTIRGEFVCDAKTFGVAKPPADALCATLNTGFSASASSSSGAAAAAKDRAQQPAPIAEGFYGLISRSSGKALQVNSGATADGAPVSQSDFDQSPNQVWQLKDTGQGYYALIARHSGKALDVQDWAVSDGARLSQFPWMDNWTQHWQLEPVGDGYFRIVSRFSGKVVDVYELNRKNGGEVRTWTYWGGENQHWRLVPIEAPKRAK